MDFKNRFTAHEFRERPQNNPFAESRRAPLSQGGQGRQGGLGGQGGLLNKFKKPTVAGNAPAGQFKKYMLEANNIFYDNRPQLKKMEQLRFIRWSLISIWAILAIGYLIVGRIQPYKGDCPVQARCGVFVHCPEYFEFHENTHSCVLSSDILLQIQHISEAQVIQLQYNYGNTDCSQNKQIPFIDVCSLFDQVEDPVKRRHYQDQSLRYFQDLQKQKSVGFKYQFCKVSPSRKRHTFSCTVDIFLSDPDHQEYMLYTILAILLSLAIYYKLTKSNRYSKMYNFLRERVLDSPNQTLNVTHTMTDLEALFGQMDEQTWGKINEIRTAGKEIGYYQDDFLYWKKM